MLQLYHFPLCPFSRKVRLALGEKQLAVTLENVDPWQAAGVLRGLNPAGEVPVLVVPGMPPLAESAAICEWLDDVASPRLVGADPPGRAEARRLMAWFDLRFWREATALLIGEKIHKRLRNGESPEPARLRQGFAALHRHLDYLGHLAERRNWLAGDGLSVADLAAAAHLSCLDYCGDIPWEDHIPARTWYARIKSRPAFRALLADSLPGLPPVPHYTDLDF